MTFFCSKENHTLATELLTAIFDKAVTIPGTLQYHAFIPTQDEKLQLKKFSSSEQHDVFSTRKKHKPQKRPSKKTTVETIAKTFNRKTKIHTKTTNNCNFKKSSITKQKE